MNTESASRRNFLRSAATATASLYGGAASFETCAQASAEQLRILVGFPPGSVPDSVSRLVAEHLGTGYSRHPLVENRPGAAGMIAVNALKAAPADGSTMLLAPGSLASAYPYLYDKLAYDPTSDLQPVSLAAEVALGLAVGPGVPVSVSNVRELVAWMRANPNLANVGSPGMGTPPHMLEAMLFRKANVPWQHIGYSGGPPATAALLGGQIAALILPEGALRPHQNAGKLRVLATSGAQRSRYLPNVATFVEQGYPELVMIDWFAFFMPRGTSTSIIDAASRRLQAAIERPELVAAYSEAGMVATSSTPAALTLRIAADRRYWEPVIRDNSIRLE